MTDKFSKTEQTRLLNDFFRHTGIGGKIVFSAGVAALDDNTRQTVFAKVQEFDEFNEGNDPHREHDFGSFVHDGQKYFWKIDYYDLAYKMGSEAPWDHKQTNRVLTVMLAEEY